MQRITASAASASSRDGEIEIRRRRERRLGATARCNLRNARHVELRAGSVAARSRTGEAALRDHFTDPTEYYTIGRKLGTGNFAKVVLATLKADRGVAATKLKAGQEVAIKVMKKPSSRSAVERLAMLRAEVEILRSMNHPNVVTLYEVFESQTKLYLVMELLTGGELFDRIVGMGKYSEEDARYFTFKLLNAVLYLHDRQICHRDLKPENILLASQEENAELKISDFGLSKVAASDELLMSTRCGTPGYVAPEVLTQERGSGGRRYGTACDMWRSA